MNFSISFLVHKYKIPNGGKKRFKGNRNKSKTNK